MVEREVEGLRVVGSKPAPGARSGDVVELEDTPASKAGARKSIQVRILVSPPNKD